MTRADREIDARYAGLRGRFGPDDPCANGYRTRGYFEHEQALLLQLIAETDDLPDRDALALDLACGSGLMLRPLSAAGRLVVGVDFNADACRGAAANGVPIVRGDVYRLPIADAAASLAVNCQFFNQQSPAAVAAFVDEAARVVAPGGRLILVWRNGAAWVHRLAHAVLRILDRLRGLPEFPVITHPISTVTQAAVAAGFTPERQLLSFPPLGLRLENPAGPLGRVLGASCVLVLRRG